MCDENAGGSIETGTAASRLIAEPTWTMCGGGSPSEARAAFRALPASRHHARDARRAMRAGLAPDPVTGVEGNCRRRWITPRPAASSRLPFRAKTRNSDQRGGVPSPLDQDSGGAAVADGPLHSVQPSANGRSSSNPKRAIGCLADTSIASSTSAHSRRLKPAGAAVSTRGPRSICVSPPRTETVAVALTGANTAP
jgi:hypothetical protein